MRAKHPALTNGKATFIDLCRPGRLGLQSNPQHEEAMPVRPKLERQSTRPISVRSTEGSESTSPSTYLVQRNERCPALHQLWNRPHILHAKELDPESQEDITQASSDLRDSPCSPDHQINSPKTTNDHGFPSYDPNKNPREANKLRQEMHPHAYGNANGRLGAGY